MTIEIVFLIIIEIILLLIIFYYFYRVVYLKTKRLEIDLDEAKDRIERHKRYEQELKDEIKFLRKRLKAVSKEHNIYESDETYELDLSQFSENEIKKIEFNEITGIEP